MSNSTTTYWYENVLGFAGEFLQRTNQSVLLKILAKMYFTEQNSRVRRSFASDDREAGIDTKFADYEKIK